MFDERWIEMVDSPIKTQLGDRWNTLTYTPGDGHAVDLLNQLSGLQCLIPKIVLFQ